jgi:hypothetical protein
MKLQTTPLSPIVLKSIPPCLRYTPCNDHATRLTLRHAHCVMSYHQHGTRKAAEILPLNLVVDRMSDLCPFDQTISKQPTTRTPTQ